MTRSRLLALGSVVAATTLMSAQHANALPPNAPPIGMICTPGTISGNTHTFNLVATTGYAQTPDGNSIFMWSYGNGDAPDNGNFQYPGPNLCVTQGQTVVVNLRNTLAEPTSVIFPGQEGAVATGGASGLLTTEAAAAIGTVSYSFAAGSPGTYAYESGSDVTKQVEMGLYGALVVRPAAHPDWAYSAGTRFDPKREFLLLLSEYDPDLHHAVETGGSYDINALHNRYYAVNGRSFPDTLQDNGVAWLPDQPYGALVRVQPFDGTRNPQPALVRMINVGLQNHPYHPHGNHMREVAQDGRELLSPSGGDASTEHFGETIGSGQTEDYLLSWADQDNWNPNTKPLPLPQPSYRTLTFKDGNTWY
jgi:FtsP/CotA-like multicopper oxidase with cupredoxin domain